MYADERPEGYDVPEFKYQVLIPQSTNHVESDGSKLLAARDTPQVFPLLGISKVVTSAAKSEYPSTSSPSGKYDIQMSNIQTESLTPLDIQLEELAASSEASSETLVNTDSLPLLPSRSGILQQTTASDNRRVSDDLTSTSTPHVTPSVETYSRIPRREREMFEYVLNIKSLHFAVTVPRLRYSVEVLKQELRSDFSLKTSTSFLWIIVQNQTVCAVSSDLSFHATTELLLKHDASVTSSNPTRWGDLPLHTAARCNSVTMATLLVAYGAEVNAVQVF